MQTMTRRITRGALVVRSTRRIGCPRAGDIGEERRHVELEPIEVPMPAVAPVEEPVPA